MDHGPHLSKEARQDNFWGFVGLDCRHTKGETLGQRVNRLGGGRVEAYNQFNTKLPYRSVNVSWP